MSALWMAAWAPTPRTSCGTAGISTSAAPTACLLTSWPWWWTMPGWALPRWCGEPTALLHGPAALPVPSAGAQSAPLCPLPAAAGPGWPPPLQAGWRPEPGKPPCQVHGRGDRGQAGLCVWPAARACSPHTGEPRYRFQLGECAQRRYLPAGKFILTKNACSLAGAGVFGSIRHLRKITGAPARGWCRCPGGSWPSRGQGPAECPSSRQCSCAA